MARKRIRLLEENLKEDGLPLTPLMDIIFLVTVFFVLTAGAALNTSLEVDVPQAESGTSTIENALVVSVQSQEMIEVNGTLTTMDGLGELLKSTIVNLNIDKNSRVTLQGNQNISYGLLVRIMDQMRLLGFYKIALVTQEPD